MMYVFSLVDEIEVCLDLTYLSDGFSIRIPRSI